MTKLEELREAVRAAREALRVALDAIDDYSRELEAATAERKLKDWEKAGINLNPAHFETYPPAPVEPKLAPGWKIGVPECIANACVFDGAKSPRSEASVKPTCKRCGEARLEWQEYCGAACSAQRNEPVKL